MEIKYNDNVIKTVPTSFWFAAERRMACYVDFTVTNNHYAYFDTVQAVLNETTGLFVLGDVEEGVYPHVTQYLRSAVKVMNTSPNIEAISKELHLHNKEYLTDNLAVLNKRIQLMQDELEYVTAYCQRYEAKDETDT